MQQLVRSNLMKPLISLLMILSCAGAHAQTFSLELGEIIGEPCVETSFQGNTPSSKFPRRITYVTATVISGRVSQSDENRIQECMTLAKSKTRNAQSATHLNSYLDLYSDQFRFCMKSSGSSAPIYDIAFQRQEKCTRPTQ